MKTEAELDAAMAQAGFKPDEATGGYRKRNKRGDWLWVSTPQAREALAAAENNVAWTEDDVEPLSETLAESLTATRIH